MNTFIVYVKNTTATTKVWGGLEYPPSSIYLIEDVDRLRLLSDPDFYSDLLVGDAIISDSENELPIRIGLGLLQQNINIVTEYYTLVQDDDVLVGNGKILHLHDDHWSLETDFEEGDDPTDNGI